MHEKNLLHKDFSLKNLILGKCGPIKFGDFGKSKIFDD